MYQLSASVILQIGASSDFRTMFSSTRLVKKFCQFAPRTINTERVQRSGGIAKQTEIKLKPKHSLYIIYLILISLESSRHCATDFEYMLRTSSLMMGISAIPRPPTARQAQNMLKRRQSSRYVSSHTPFFPAPSSTSKIHIA